MAEKHKLINNIDDNMKMYIKIMALLSVILAGCQKEEVTTSNGNFPDDGVIRVTTEVAHTRASMTTDDLTLFTMQVTHPTDNNYSYYAMMNRNDASSPWGSYEPSSSTSYTPLQMLWKNKRDRVKISAMGISANLISQTYFNQSFMYFIKANQLSHKFYYLSSDILYMPPTEIDPANDLLIDGKVKVALGHLFSQFTLNVTLGTEFNNENGTAINPITDLAVNGTYCEVSFNASTGVWGNLGGKVQPVTPWHEEAMYSAGGGVTTSAVARYECILIPQTVNSGNFTISFEINGRKYIWTATKDIILKSGKKYTLNLKVGKDIVTAGTMSASEWGNGTGGSMETE